MTPFLYEENKQFGEMNGRRVIRYDFVYRGLFQFFSVYGYSRKCLLVCLSLFVGCALAVKYRDADKSLARPD